MAHAAGAMMLNFFTRYLWLKGNVPVFRMIFGG
jgi:hypothetical protein